MKSIGLNRIEEKCEYLGQELDTRCKIFTAVYVPSDYQLNEYCSKKEHHNCPFYSAAESSNSLNVNEFRSMNL
jgi:hypothetical protein